MRIESRFVTMEELIVRDHKLLFTIISYVAILMIFINLSFFFSPVLGTIATAIYLIINGTFLGRAFFEQEDHFLSFMLGNLLLVTCLALTAWAILIIYNLDPTRSILVLCIVTAAASLLSKRKKRLVPRISSEKPKISPYLYVVRLLYLFAVGLLFYRLFSVRSGEVYTVWGVISYLFIFLFLASTFLLLLLLFSSDRTRYKIAFTILHSIISHAFMVIIFPAGNVGVQQMFLGRNRLVYENIVPLGYGWTLESARALESIPQRIYALARGANFQASFSVIIARMFSVDIYWVHLLLVPLLWGIFVPIIAFMFSKVLFGNERISVLSCFAVSLFPANILWGAESISNSLSYVFFFCLVVFFLKYIKSNGRRDLYLIAVFFLASLLSHVLAGAIALSLFLLVYAIKVYQTEKEDSPANARFTLLVAFIVSASLLPFALVLRRFFYPSANTHFSLEKVSQLSPFETLFSLLFGGYFGFISREAYITALIYGIAPLIGLIGMIYVLRTIGKKPRKRSIDACLLFLFLGFLMIAVDDRIVKFFMANVPFVEAERLWLFRDFLLVPFVALVIGGTIHETLSFSQRLSKKIVLYIRKTPFTIVSSKAYSFFAGSHSAIGTSFAYILTYIPVLTVVSSLATASLYYAYPHWAPLQTTSYEIEAVKFIEQNTQERYIVICDQWIIFAGQMFVGINNPQSYYFSNADPQGIALFIKMRNNPSNQTMTEAMKINNATVAYFIIGKARIGTEMYNDVINRAQQNNTQTYKIFYYPENEEKLRIFFYKRNSDKLNTDMNTESGSSVTQIALNIRKIHQNRPYY